MTSTGRFTLPSEENFAEKTKELAELWGADAIRNSDGTHLDESVLALGKKIYSAYFPTRAHNEWITLHMDETPQVYLLTGRVLAEADIVDVPLMDGFFEEQLKPNRDADPHKYWEVVDRTANEVVDASLWTLDEDTDTVHVSGATPMHEYTVSFLAYIIWDPVEMYNHLTNGWGDKEHEIPFDIYHPATRKFVFDTFEQWLKDNPQVDVVRFTTFFYQFTLLFDQKQREKVVDWFGCACTVSPAALDDFEKEYGYRLRPEDFVNEGSYNSAWRVPRKPQRDWIDFLSHFVRANVKKLASLSHEAGKEAMMFLGDQWIGTEPYKDGFEDLGLDAVVGSIGDGTTTRMIADIPGVKYTEGRFLPYFFPDTFYEGNDPSIEGLDNWRKARRAILRSPISRMGYGGYLSLAAKFPKFVDTVTHIADEFRDIHDRTGGVAAEGELNVAILNSWGKMRSWMAFTVAHALPNKQTYSYYGILESLSGCGGGQGIKPLGGIDFGEPIANTFPVNEDVTLLRADGGQVQLAVNEYGKGRGVYVSGLPYSAANARLLERILFWASHNEDKYTAYSSTNPECEVAVFPDAGQYCVINNTDRPQSTDVALPDGSVEHFDLDQSAIAWRNL